VAPLPQNAPLFRIASFSRKMLPSTTKISSWRVFSCLCVVVLTAACESQDAAPPEPPRPAVVVATVSRTSVPLALTYAARTAGSREVEVRARVRGILLERRYQEGTRVKAGQRMFQIDPAPFEANLARATAELASAQARLREAERTRARIDTLLKEKLVSQSQRDEALAQFEVSQAAVAAAEAAVRNAKIDLQYTDVRAPIAGLTSNERRSEGSLVDTDGEESLLTRIVQIDPLYVEFSLPQGEASALRAQLNQRGGLQVRLLLENGREHPQFAQLTFLDNTVDADTGTVRARAVLANTDGALLPGQFVRARVEGVQLGEAVSVPRKALMPSPQGHFVWVVGADEAVSPQPVQIERSVGNNVLITGLEPGTRYVQEGVMKVQPGVKVQAVAPAQNDEAAGKKQGAA
jgi:membrane fusion protein, multidrug efflux system